MAASTNKSIYLNLREAVEAIEDIGIGEVGIQCFWNLFTRVLSDPMMLPFKRHFCTALESAVKAHNGFGKGAVTMREMIDSYMLLPDAMRRIQRARPQLKVSKAPNSLKLLIEEMESCLHHG